METLNGLSAQVNPLLDFVLRDDLTESALQEFIDTTSQEKPKKK